MQNLENLDVFEILITQKLLKCLKDPFVRSALKCIKTNSYLGIVNPLPLSDNLGEENQTLHACVDTEAVGQGV